MNNKDPPLTVNESMKRKVSYCAIAHSKNNKIPSCNNSKSYCSITFSMAPRTFPTGEA